VLAQNFGVQASLFGHTPDPSERYIFPTPMFNPAIDEMLAIHYMRLVAVYKTAGNMDSVRPPAPAKRLAP